ncbi:MAG: hypothetical protein HY293_12785 [Planctomycetes bacterium]|nr:hypothetical protein [Planctomycetota bacterium]
MVARLIPTQEPVTLNQANHPENAIPLAKDGAPGLGSTIAICALSGLIGATFGAAALSSAFLAGSPLDVLSLVPLTATVVVLMSSWVGAFYWMMKQDPDRHET